MRIPVKKYVIVWEVNFLYPIDIIRKKTNRRMKVCCVLELFAGITKLISFLFYFVYIIISDLIWWISEAMNDLFFF